MPYFENIEWLGYNHIPDCDIWVDKRFVGYYCLNYAHSGSIGWVDRNGSFSRHKAPVAWWTFPNRRFQYGCEDDIRWDQRFVNFRGPRVQEYLDKGLLPVGNDEPLLSIPGSARFRRSFDQLFTELDSHSSGQRAIHLLEGLLLQLHEQTREGDGSEGWERKINSLISRIRERPEQPWILEEEARGIGLSYTHFRRLFRQVTGLPPNRFIQNQRLLKAAAQLRRSDSAIKSIAAMCGYEDVYYFTRIFSKSYGMPPGEYRNKSRMAD